MGSNGFTKQIKIGWGEPMLLN